MRAVLKGDWDEDAICFCLDNGHDLGETNDEVFQLIFGITEA